ncbi:MAG: hypothetical protein IT338_17650 [Thermomicrobiales bacterium]|nr:hypothetical protein [Thermomicrobiales bacterium]
MTTTDEQGTEISAAERRNALYGDVIRALGELIAFEMGDEQGGVRRFARVQKLAQFAETIAASYATRVADVVTMPGVGGYDNNADDMLGEVADDELRRPLGAPYHGADRPLMPRALRQPVMVANPDLLPPPAMQTALAAMTQMIRPLAAAIRQQQGPTTSIRRMRELVQAREAALAIGQPTDDLDRQIAAAVRDVAADEPPTETEGDPT